MTESQDNSTKPVEQNKETLFQQLIPDDGAEDVLRDVQSLDRNEPGPSFGWKIELIFDSEDIPDIIDELEGIIDEGQ